jgi:hypothetical protein
MKMLAILLCALPLAASEMEKLGFMAGCWSGSNGREQFEEMWMKPAAGSMLGAARTLVSGKTVFFETHVISVDKEGKTVMNIRLRTNPTTTPFTLIQASGEEAVFSNPAHDYPQRVIYRKTADGLLGRIEGVEKGKEKAIDYPMKRIACQ